MQDRELKQDVLEYFSRTYHHWSQVYELGDSKTVYRSAFARRRTIVAKMIHIHGDGRPVRVLDAGCGPGLVMEELAHDGNVVFGIDFAEILLKEAKKRVSKFAGNDLRCLRSDIEDLPFKDESFDVVVCLGVLQYLKDDRKSLLEMSRVVKDGGKLLVCIPNKTKLNIFLDPVNVLRSVKYLLKLIVSKRKPDNSIFSLTYNSGDRMRKYSLHRFERLAKQYDLQMVSVVGVDYGPLTLFRWDFLPPSISLLVSEMFVRLSKQKGFSWIQRLAGQWVIAFSKNRQRLVNS